MDKNVSGCFFLNTVYVVLLLLQMLFVVNQLEFYAALLYCDNTDLRQLI